MQVKLSNIAERVHAYGVCDDPEYFYNYIDYIYNEMGVPQHLKSRDLVLCKQARVGYNSNNNNNAANTNMNTNNTNTTNNNMKVLSGSIP